MVLVVDGLRTYFFTSGGVVKAVDGVSFSVGNGEIFGLVGESGSGKSVTALSIMRLVPPPGRIVGGRVLLDGKDILLMNEREISKIRGRKISMIFQDPMTSLNPVLKIGDQLVETIMLHSGMGPTEARKKAIELLTDVGISDAEVRLEQYPFHLSGGMKQRVMIAMALAATPRLLIADEPTTNLDVTTQAQILDLIRHVRDVYGMAVMLLTHNLGIVAWLCDKVAVMYAGRIVEYTDTVTLFNNPLHPYTQLLIKAIPRIDVRKERLESIEGEVPDMITLPPGCRFHPRCPYAKQICKMMTPQLVEVERGHYVECLIYDSG